MNDTIGYQVAEQRPAQDLTITFADGISFTARYTGVDLTSNTGEYDGQTYLHLRLHLTAPLDATINPGVCGHVVSSDPDYPCILPHGHGPDIDHRDTNGDTW